MLFLLFTLTQLIKPNYLVILPTDAAPQLHWKPTPFITVLHGVATCMRQEGTNEGYHNTVKHLLLPNTASQEDEKPHTTRLDDRGYYLIRA